MSFLRRLSVLVSAGLLVATSLLVPVDGRAQQASPEQLRMIQQLPQDQRDALAKSLGIQLPAQPGQAAPEFPETVVPADTESAAEEPVGPPRLQPSDTVIVDLQTRGNDTPEDRRQLEAAYSRNPQLREVEGPNAYELTEDGRLEFPGITAIPVAGLTEPQAARRIEADPSLRIFSATVMKLPLQPLGARALEPFGYYLFKGAPVTFAPATDVPVPPDYVIGPGDELKVQLFGKQNAVYTLAVDRDGAISFPELGPIAVVGLTFEQARELIGRRVSEQMIGVQVSVTMGQLRSIRVFVLGDVNRPGSFTVSALSTMTNALFVSGGISPVGSMRRVELKRNGKLVQSLDLYDLLLKGDNSKDVRLMPNDVIFVPPKGRTVSVAGEVQRPAIYELSGESTAGQVISLAGGLTPVAARSGVRIERVAGAGGREVQTIDLSQADGSAAAVRSGDVLTVGSVPDVLTDHVMLAGHVQRPGNFQWRPGMRLTDLIASFNELRPDADRHYVLIRRQSDISGPVEVVSADLASALARPGSDSDPVLRNLDEVTVFDLDSGRAAVMQPLLEQLRLQGVFGEPAREVSVGGMVRAPGTYPLEDGMMVSDLIRAGASLSDSAYGLGAELTRYTIVDGIRREVAVIPVDLGAVLSGDPAADIALEPFDYLNVKRISQWTSQASVELRGEVRFPGTYPIKIGETLRHVIERAGGLTPQAFPQGAVFLRDDLRKREQRELDRLQNRLEADLAAMTLQATRAAASGVQTAGDGSLAVGQSILSQLRTAEPVGRLVIDLPRLLASDGDYDLTLKDGDRLLVPDVTQEVTVLGEVQYPTSHLHRDSYSRDDYLSMSGGLTANADEDRIYIVRANGEVIAHRGGSYWFREGKGTDVQPGDTIVVPLDVDRVPRLALWQSSTTILYNLAIAVAAIGSL